MRKRKAAGCACCGTIKEKINIFLAATAEGLACSMRIPVGDEGVNVAGVVNAPENYLLPCYIGLGYPSEDRPKIQQVEYSAKQKMHFGQW